MHSVAFAQRQAAELVFDLSGGKMARRGGRLLPPLRDVMFRQPEGPRVSPRGSRGRAQLPVVRKSFILRPRERPGSAAIGAAVSLLISWRALSYPRTIGEGSSQWRLPPSRFGGSMDKTLN